MKWLAKNWGFVSSALVLFLNVELVVMPVLVFLTNIRGNLFFYIASICATSEQFYWYWVPLQRFKEAVASKVTLAAQKPTITKIIKEFHERGLAVSVITLARLIENAVSDIARFIANHVLKITEIDNFVKSKKFCLIIFVAKWFGYAGLCGFMFILGCTPGVWWIAGLAYCRSRRWFVGILFLAAGNILKTYYWSLVFLHYYP